jgi:hypothetical protein
MGICTLFLLVASLYLTTQTINFLHRWRAQRAFALVGNVWYQPGPTAAKNLIRFGFVNPPESGSQKSDDYWISSLSRNRIFGASNFCSYPVFALSGEKTYEGLQSCCRRHGNQRTKKARALH